MDVRLANFTSPDRGPGTAALAPASSASRTPIIGKVMRSSCSAAGTRSTVRSKETSALGALARDADVIVFDYPGFGESAGTPTPETILETALAV